MKCNIIINDDVNNVEYIENNIKKKTNDKQVLLNNILIKICDVFQNKNVVLKNNTIIYHHNQYEFEIIIEADITKLNAIVKKNYSNIDKVLYYAVVYSDCIELDNILNKDNDCACNEHMKLWHSIIFNSFSKPKTKLNTVELNNLNNSTVCANTSYIPNCIYVGTKRIVDINTTNKYFFINIYKYFAFLIYIDSMKTNYEKIYSKDNKHKIGHLLEVQEIYRKTNLTELTYFNKEVLKYLENKNEIELVKSDAQNHADLSFYHNESKLNTRLNMMNNIVAVLALLVALGTIIYSN